MKKLLTVILVAACIPTVTAQRIIKSRSISDHTVYLKGSDFEGVIFSADYTPKRYIYADSIKRFTPAAIDILAAEKLLRKDVKLHGKGIIDDYFICKKLRKYLRQYAGFVIPNGQKIIFINFIWKKDIFVEEKDHKQFPQIPYSDWKDEWSFYFDGGHFFWRIKINLSTLKVFGFEENGLA